MRQGAVKRKGTDPHDDFSRWPQIYLPTWQNYVHGTHKGVFSIDDRNLVWNCGRCTRAPGFSRPGFSLWNTSPSLWCRSGQKSENLCVSPAVALDLVHSLVTPSMTYLTTSFLLSALRSVLYEHVFGTSSGLDFAAGFRYREFKDSWCACLVSSLLLHSTLLEVLVV